MNLTHDASTTSLIIAKGIAGGIEALARHLRVPKKQLASWIEGEVETPRAVFLRVETYLAGTLAQRGSESSARQNFSISR